MSIKNNGHHRALRPQVKMIAADATCTQSDTPELDEPIYSFAKSSCDVASSIAQGQRRFAIYPRNWAAIQATMNRQAVQSQKQHNAA